jgi:hypothetical protein
MLDVVAGHLTRSTQSTVFTLHDCIVTTEENLEFLESFMKETFTVTIGFAQISNLKVQSPAGFAGCLLRCFGVSGAFLLKTYN